MWQGLAISQEHIQIRRVHLIHLKWTLFLVSSFLFGQGGISLPKYYPAKFLKDIRRSFLPYAAYVKGDNMNIQAIISF